MSISMYMKVEVLQLQLISWPLLPVGNTGSSRVEVLLLAINQPVDNQVNKKLILTTCMVVSRIDQASKINGGSVW